MPLSVSTVEREHLHDRRYEFQGFRRKDGLWDIEGRMTDSKTYGFPNQDRGRIEAGEPIHDMRIRLTLDIHFLVHDIEVSTDAAPFGICAGITPKFSAVKGLRIGPGWKRALKEKLSGVHGCTHHVEMLGAMATVAYQTLWSKGGRDQDEKKEAESAKRPAILDSCHALASDSPVVKKLWPKFYTGKEEKRA